VCVCVCVCVYMCDRAFFYNPIFSPFDFSARTRWCVLLFLPKALYLLSLALLDSVPHRLLSLCDYDRICVLDAGRVRFTSTEWMKEGNSGIACGRWTDLIVQNAQHTNTHTPTNRWWSTRRRWSSCASRRATSAHCARRRVLVGGGVGVGWFVGISHAVREGALLLVVLVLVLVGSFEILRRTDRVSSGPPLNSIDTNKTGVAPAVAWGAGDRRWMCHTLFD